MAARGQGRLPPPLMDLLANISAAAGGIADKALPFVADDDAAYFRTFHLLVEKPWSVTGEPELTSPRLLWPLGGGLPEDQKDLLTVRRRSTLAGTPGGRGKGWI